MSWQRLQRQHCKAAAGQLQGSLIAWLSVAAATHRAERSSRPWPSCLLTRLQLVEPFSLASLVHLAYHAAVQLALGASEVV